MRSGITDDFAGGCRRAQESLRPQVSSTVSGPARKISEEDISLSEIWGLKIGLQLAYKNWQMAHDMVDRFRNEHGLAELPTADDSPAALGLDQRTCNGLEKAGIVTIGQLAKVNCADLMAISGFGDRTVCEILSKLSKLTVISFLGFSGSFV
jgi:hypothetical protein